MYQQLKGCLPHPLQPYLTPANTHVPDNQHDSHIHQELLPPQPKVYTHTHTHTHTALNNQRASHTHSIIKALHLHTPITKELHTHTHPNNQRVHTPTHKVPTTKAVYTHTSPKEFYSPKQGLRTHPPKSKKRFTPTHSGPSSRCSPSPQKKTPRHLGLFATAADT